MLAEKEWKYRCSSRQAVFPLPWLDEHKFWPPVRRIDNVYGDRRLCPPMGGYAEQEA